MFRSINGFEGKYEVSDSGEVRSLDRTVSGRFCKGKTLKAGKVYGYDSYTLSNGRKNKRVVTAHILVMENFVGPRPEGMVIDHINGDRSDNRLENLQYISQKENVRKGAVRKLRHTGVYKYGKKFSVMKNIGKKVIWVGVFDTYEKAVLVSEECVDAESILNLKEKYRRNKKRKL